MIDAIFSAANLTAMIGWLLLITLPRWRGISQMAARLVIPTLLAIAYSALFAAFWSRGQGGFGSLDQVQALLSKRELLLAGWLHYLAFDLFVGAWVNRTLQRAGVPHLLVIPVLLLTFMFGPVGYFAAICLQVTWRIGSVKHEPQWLTRFVSREPHLMAASILCLATAMPLALAAAMDDRTFLGANVWLKPLKFHTSVAIYLATLAFFYPLAGAVFGRTLAGKYVVWAALASGILELIYIDIRAGRAEASHFNYSSPLAIALYAMMGLGAVILASAGPVLAVGIAREKSTSVSPVFRFSVILGLWMGFLLGGIEGGVMSARKGHFVGEQPMAASVLPFTGWSESVGDLRVAHFVGMHSQQVVPLFGALAAWILGNKARPVVVGFAVLYAIGTVALFVEALLGHPAITF